jgi:hypothetical protein
MNRLLIVAAMLTVFGVLLVTGTASAQQEREEVMVVIPMKYMSAATAAQLFGGTVIAPSPMYGQSAFGSRGSANRNYGGGYDSGGRVGSYQSGPSIGGSYGQFGQGNSYWR